VSQIPEANAAIDVCSNLRRVPFVEKALVRVSNRTGSTASILLEPRE
jgi:hypothetical protein